MNITFDLETLGNTASAPIVQIGAVKFADDGKINEEFIRNIKLSSLERYGFNVEYGTLKWWFEQEDRAIKSVFCNTDTVDIRKALMDFHDWIEKPGDYVYWSHATFDPPVLTNSILKVGLKPFIPFRHHRDIRTLTHFAGKVEVDRVGIHHNALDDCIYQAKYISKCIEKINM